MAQKTMKATSKGKGTCPVFVQPPKKVPYGSLAPPCPQTIDFKIKQKRASLSFPKDPLPNGLFIPFPKPVEKKSERILETESRTAKGAANIMRRIKSAQEKFTYPGWLIELQSDKLTVLTNIKDLLRQGKPICKMIDELAAAVQQLGIPVPKEEIVEILKRIPYEGAGWSFPHFLLAMGSPTLARETGAFMDPIKMRQCRGMSAPSGDEGDGHYEKRSKVDRLHQPTHFDKIDTWPLTEEEAKKRSKNKSKTKEKREDTTHPIDVTPYSLREKVFFSGLLIFEMYHTMLAVEDIYFKDQNIPKPEDKVLKAEAQRGFGANDKGTKKIGASEWDVRALPPVPAMSPYVDELPFVASRWKIQKPNEKERIYQKRRTLTKFQPLHLVVKPPGQKHLEGKITVTENHERIKQAMQYLAASGNCVAKLPFSHCIVHLSDTFVEKLEEVNMRSMEGEPLPKIYPNNDMAYLMRGIKELYLPHYIPEKIKRMKFMIPFDVALCLRRVSQDFRQKHLKIIQERQVAFRNRAWDLMHVDRIPCGVLRENFVYAFDTYLPYKVELPDVSLIGPLPY